MRKRLARLTLVLLALFLVLIPPAAAGVSHVYVLNLNHFQEVDQTMAIQVERAVKTAESDGAALVIVLDTPGGLVSSAFAIKDTLLKAKVPTIAWVEGNALSAGALIATSAEKLYMAKGATIGAAEPRPEGSTVKADYKVVDAVVANFRSAAQARGRDAAIAAAMVDTNARLSWQQGKLLLLTDTEAVEHHYADGQAQSIADALDLAGIKGYTLQTIQPVSSDTVGRVLTTPWVAILLLVVGVIAIGLEFAKPGLTLPGVVGVTALGLFFAGNFLIGTAGWVEVALAVIGAILLVVEMFIPGFGVFGFSGLGALALSIFMSVPDPRNAVAYMLWTALAGTGAFVLIARRFSKQGLGKWLTLEQTAQGWEKARPDLGALVGQSGEALTALRPAGTAQFGEQRVEVLTEGEFVSAGTPVRVLRVQGARVVVRSTADN
ncbi:MAG TPA: NfeD family protein [Symbiobacteriaceae bacterium]|nr:NfeD family protein [Symbiobacteriaceae bacterium]